MEASSGAWARANGQFLGGYVLAGVMLVLVNWLRPGFASSGSVTSLLIASTVLGVASCGQTLVIILQGFDLSIPSIMTGAAVGVCLLSDRGLPGWGAVLVILGLAATVGVVNGVGIGHFGINPVIMTLGVGSIAAGALVVLSHGVPPGEPPTGLTSLASRSVGFLPTMAVLWAVLAILASTVLSFTPFGRRLYAVGSSPRVAAYSGIRSSLVVAAAYAVSGVTAGLAGLLLVGWVGQASLGMGSPYLFSTVAAVAIGGTSMAGGQGSYWGTCGGALALTVLTALLPVFNLDKWAQSVLFGLVVLVAIIAIPRGEESEV